jgi:hypothetical protein
VHVLFARDRSHVDATHAHLEAPMDRATRELRREGVDIPRAARVVVDALA